MGNPPRRLVLSKLMKRYFKKQTTTNVNSAEASSLKNELVQCWETHGVDHPKCQHLIPRFDKGWAIDMSQSEKYADEVRQYPSHLNNLLTPPQNQIYAKGTNSTMFWRTNRPYNTPKR